MKTVWTRYLLLLGSPLPNDAWLIDRCEIPFEVKNELGYCFPGIIFCQSCSIDVSRPGVALTLVPSRLSCAFLPVFAAVTRVSSLAMFVRLRDSLV